MSHTIGVPSVSVCHRTIVLSKLLDTKLTSFRFRNLHKIRRHIDDYSTEVNRSFIYNIRDKNTRNFYPFYFNVVLAVFSVPSFYRTPRN